MALTSPKTWSRGNYGKKVAVYKPGINTSEAVYISLKALNETQ